MCRLLRSAKDNMLEGEELLKAAGEFLDKF